MRYLDCLRKHASASTECRHLNRDYLGCRMKKYVCLRLVCVCRGLLNARCRGLMEPDEWKNLGLSNLKGDDAPATAKTPSAAEALDGGTGGKN